MAQTATGNGERASLRHPKGLYLLFTTEMWERTSFYGMRALLVLYMAAQTSKGGLGWSDEKALDIYGWYTALVYLTPIIGGSIADRYIGQRRAVMIGGTLMMIGQFLLAVPGMPTFYAGLGFLILGNGMFKPNISTMVGGLYPEKDPRRDSAFSIFYMGINVGATLGALGCGYLGEEIGWSYGFAGAGVGMLLGIISFGLFSKRLLGNVGLSPNRPTEGKTETAKPSAGLTREEVQRIIVLLVIIVFAGAFWCAYEQAGGLMNLYAERKTDRMFMGREIPASWFQAVNSIFIILFAPVAGRIWITLAKRDRDPSSVVKMGLGLVLAGAGFVLMVLAAYQNQQGQKSAASLLVLTYLLHTWGELCLSPVGLSLTTKLAPKHLASMLMGVWFLSNFLGNKMAGEVGKLASHYGDLTVFAGLAIGTGTLGVVMLVLSPILKRMTHGADETKSMEEIAAETGKSDSTATASAAG